MIVDLIQLVILKIINEILDVKLDNLSLDYLLILFYCSLL